MRMTMEQRKQAYRIAVVDTLRVFYGQTEAAAEILVANWWNRLVHIAAYKSGLFLHDEPMNTAADLSDSETVVISDDNRDAYERMLEAAARQVISSTPKKKGVQRTSRPLTMQAAVGK